MTREETNNAYEFSDRTPAYLIGYAQGTLKQLAARLRNAENGEVDLAWLAQKLQDTYDVLEITFHNYNKERELAIREQHGYDWLRVPCSNSLETKGL